MDARVPVLHVDYANDLPLRDDGHRKEGFKRVLRQILEELESRVVIRFARNRQETPFSCYPTGETFIQPDANFPHILPIRITGGAENEFTVFYQVDQTGIAAEEVTDEIYDLLQDVIQLHIPGHQSAYFLEQPELLLRSLEARFEFPGLGHQYTLWQRADLPVRMS